MAKSIDDESSQGHKSGSGDTSGGSEKPVPMTTIWASVQRQASSADGECSQIISWG
jgi:hypothetical protein